MSGKKDEFLTDTLNHISYDPPILTPQQEESLYRLCWGQMMAVAIRYIPDRETAREIVNDSFIKAFRSISSFKGDGEHKAATFRAWLVRITINTAIDRFRAERSIPETMQLDDIKDHPHVEVEDRLDIEDILMLLKELPQLHRIVFNLYEIEGYSHHEIGEMIDIPTSSSRVYLAKAKQKLRELYINYFRKGHHG